MCYAYFDFDGTFIPGDSILYWMRFYFKAKPYKRFFMVINWLGILLYLLRLIDSATLKRVFLMHAAYESQEHLDTLAKQFVQKELVPRIYPDMLERMWAHYTLGHRVVVISASCMFYLKHLNAHFPPCLILGTELVVPQTAWLRFPKYRRGIGNVKGKNKLNLIKLRVDLPSSGEASFGYSDSISDKYLLNFAQFPYCVRPDLRLRQRALAKDWPVLWPGKAKSCLRDGLVSLLLLLFGIGAKAGQAMQGEGKESRGRRPEERVSLDLYLNLKNRVNSEFPEDNFRELHSRVFTALPTLQEISSRYPDIFRQASLIQKGGVKEGMELEYRRYMLVFKERDWEIKQI